MAALRSSFWTNLLRRKTLTSETMRSGLKRCLGLGDLTFLAIGSMVGSGLYVLTGTIARGVAGPAVVISYIIAAFASGLSAVCYAEFGARIPVTGSAYQFTYLSIGELWAFIIGWNVLIEHIVSASAVAKSWSAYLDSALGYPVKNYMIVHCPMVGGGVFAQYPDFVAMGILILATIIIISGAQLSSKVTAGFAGLNLIIVCIIVGCGLHLGDLKNWTEVKGGFFPFGLSGTISGASTLIFSYVGYEVIASTTEEALNPNRDVPLSLFVGLSVVAIAYVGASAALTLMVPYYDISPLSPFPEAFMRYGWEWTRYLVTVGALAAMITTMVASLYVVPRYLMAMARDGLLMQFFSKVTKTTQIPYVSVIIAGVSCILFAITFQLKALVEFISIGQLLACTFVAICVVKLRYEPNTISRYMEMHSLENADENGNTAESVTSGATERSNLSTNFTTTEINDPPVEHGKIPENFEGLASPRSTISTKSNTSEENTINTTEHIVGTVKTEILNSKYGYLFTWTTEYSPGTVPNWLVIITAFCLSVVSVMITFTHEYISSWWCILFVTIFGLLALLAMTSLLAFHQDKTIKTFKVPGVPFLPFTSAFINILLMLKLQYMTWVRLGIWILVGLVVYFSYGYWHSNERRNAEEPRAE